MNLPIKHYKSGYQIRYILKDNYKIFNRKSWLTETTNSCVYIFTNNSNIFWKIPFLGIITGQIFYVGMGRWNEFNIYQSRPFTHKLDNLSDIINENYTCWCLTGITFTEAHTLEAFLIKDLINNGFKLSKSNIKYNFDKNVLVNKRREKRWEKEINNILLSENQW